MQTVANVSSPLGKTKRNNTKQKNIALLFKEDAQTIEFINEISQRKDIGEYPKYSNVIYVCNKNG